MQAMSGPGTASRVVRANLGQADDALQTYDRATELADYPPIVWRRGYLLLESGRLPEARASFEQAIARNPNETAAHAGLARVDLLEGNADDAAERLEPMVTRGGQAYLHHLLGMAYRQAGRPEDAARELERGRNSVAVWRDPWTEETVALRAGFDWTLTEARRALGDGRVDIALPALEALKQQRPTDRELLVTLGTALCGGGSQPRRRRHLS